jgi:methylated-DNA-[protein]-cysteine S-methyltransferase
MNESDTKKSGRTNGTLYFDSLKVPSGEITVFVTEGGAVSGVSFFGEPKASAPARVVRDKARCGKAIRELTEYFAGKRTSFDLELDLGSGTPFQKKVWRSLTKIPFGKTRSYMELAKAIGHPRACRAVGNAAGLNPIPIIIPCHRLLASGGKLGGYSGGVDKKVMLLELEKANQ